MQHRNYRLFFSGQLISLIGTWMQTVAQSWLVYRLTGSSLLLGLVGFASQIPGLPAGAARRRGRRPLQPASHRSWRRRSTAMVLAFVLAALTLSATSGSGTSSCSPLLLGVVNAFDIPTRQAFVVEMVGPDDLVNAIALNSSMVNGARMVGPAVAGVPWRRSARAGASSPTA